MNPFALMVIGFTLVLGGFLVPFLMVLRLLEAGFALSFSAHFASLMGLFLALYGAVQYSRWRRRDDNDRTWRL